MCTSMVRKQPKKPIRVFLQGSSHDLDAGRRATGGTPISRWSRPCASPAMRSRSPGMRASTVCRMVAPCSLTRCAGCGEPERTKACRGCASALGCAQVHQPPEQPGISAMLETVDQMACHGQEIRLVAWVPRFQRAGGQGVPALCVGVLAHAGVRIRSRRAAPGAGCSVQDPARQPRRRQHQRQREMNRCRRRSAAAAFDRAGPRGESEQRQDRTAAPWWVQRPPPQGGHQCRWPSSSKGSRSAWTARLPITGAVCATRPMGFGSSRSECHRSESP